MDVSKVKSFLASIKADIYQLEEYIGREPESSTNTVAIKLESISPPPSPKNPTSPVYSPTSPAYSTTSPDNSSTSPSYSTSPPTFVKSSLKTAKLPQFVVFPQWPWLDEHGKRKIPPKDNGIKRPPQSILRPTSCDEFKNTSTSTGSIDSSGHDNESNIGISSFGHCNDLKTSVNTSDSNAPEVDGPPTEGKTSITMTIKQHLERGSMTFLYVPKQEHIDYLSDTSDDTSIMTPDNQYKKQKHC